MNLKAQVSHFSLVELVAVISIIIIVTGLVVSNLGRLPAFASLNNNAEAIRELFTTARTRAVATGKDQKIIYNRESRVFSLKESADPTEDDATTDKVAASFTLPDAIKIEFRNQEDNRDDLEFTCYADGSIGTPDMILTLRKHKVKLYSSKLTGQMFIEQVKDESDS